MRFDVNFVTFDIETGGLKAEKNPVLEIALYSMEKGLDDNDDYNNIIKPYGDYVIEDAALAANGMNLDLINEKGIDSGQVVKDVIKYLKGNKVGRNLPVLCGHNIIKFDIPFMIEFFKFHGEDFTKYYNTDFLLDTMWWSRMYWLESPNYKLGTCCDNAGIELVDAHRAVSDTIANKELVKYFIKSLRSGEAEGEQKEKKRFRDTFKF